MNAIEWECTDNEGRTNSELSQDEPGDDDFMREIIKLRRMREEKKALVYFELVSQGRLLPK